MSKIFLKTRALNTTIDYRLERTRTDRGRKIQELRSLYGVLFKTQPGLQNGVDLINLFHPEEWY